MGVQQTSIDSYHEELASGRVGSQLDQIMILLRYADEPVSDKDIHKATGIPVHTVSARRNTGIKKGWIRQNGTKIDPKTKKEVCTREAVR